MRTTFFFVLLVYYVYNHMFLHFFKTYNVTAILYNAYGRSFISFRYNIKK
jgi:hypothetical protein